MTNDVDVLLRVVWDEGPYWARWLCTIDWSNGTMLREGVGGCGPSPAAALVQALAYLARHPPTAAFTITHG